MPRVLVVSVVAGWCFCAAPDTPPAPPVASAASAIDFTSSNAPLPSASEFEALVQVNPVAAVHAGIRRYQAEVSGFRAVFHKRERIGGKLRDPEVIRVAFRNEPFSVLMLWDQGGGVADGTLYVRGENAGQMKVWVSKLFVKGVDPRGSMPRSSARYTIEEFGLVQSMKRTHRAWSAAQAAGEMRFEYLGRKAVTELGGRECFVVKRTCPADDIDAFASGEPDDVTDKNRADSFRTVTIYLDCENWLQVGTELHRADGEWVGSYFFRDLRLNPPFEKGTFTTAAFKKTN